jgi:monoamine oxidase
MANNPSSYSNIEFSPKLLVEKQGLVADSMAGVHAKVIVSYANAWWREAGLDGNLFSDIGPITYGIEIAVPELEQRSLASYITREFLRKWYALLEGERHGAVIDCLASFGRRRIG